MSRPPRFAITRSMIASGAVRLAGPELHHLRDVMRLHAGADIALIDETNIEYVGRIERLEPHQAIIALSDSVPRAAPTTGELILAAGLIKGPRMDFLVEKAAELGASQLITLLCARSVVRGPGAQRVERWRRLATAAAKQSLAPQRMALAPPMTVAELVRAVPQETFAVVCVSDGPPLSAILRKAAPRGLLLACGAEGGFDPVELALMRDAGYCAASLGPNRLRAETAALVALSIAAAEIHERSGR
ncbi:MAG TPA: RsmE family RNA methyltransferase [Candidatus Binataceae bacterium]|nr:RsmE family RNA methyltransferase [Candidatus Binataceae bacterium]